MTLENNPNESPVRAGDSIRPNEAEEATITRPYRVEDTGPITAADAIDMVLRFSNSHFDKAAHRPGREHARISVPTDPRRDDDIRLIAFIKQSAARIKEMERGMNTKYWEGIRAENVELREKVEAMKERLAEEKSQLDDAAKRMGEMRDRLDRKNAAMLENCELYFAVVAERDQLAANIVGLNASREMLTKALAEERKERDALRDALDAAERMYECAKALILRRSREDRLRENLGNSINAYDAASQRVYLKSPSPSPSPCPTCEKMSAALKKLPAKMCLRCKARHGVFLCGDGSFAHGTDDMGDGVYAAPERCEADHIHRVIFSLATPAPENPPTQQKIAEGQGKGESV